MLESHVFLKISGLLYVGLGTNALLALSSLPLIAVLGVMRPGEGWLLLAVAAVLAVPGLAAAFDVFRGYPDDGSVSVIRTFAKSWWRHLRKSLTVAVLAVTAVSVLIIDIVWAWGHQIGAVAIPVFGMGVALALIVALGCLVGLVDRPDATLRSLARASVYLMVRRWYLTLFSVVGGGVLLLIVAERPALGMGVAAAPLLFLVWTNTRHTLKPILA